MIIFLKMFKPFKNFKKIRFYVKFFKTNIKCSKNLIKSWESREQFFFKFQNVNFMKTKKNL